MSRPAERFQSRFKLVGMPEDLHDVVGPSVPECAASGRRVTDLEPVVVGDRPIVFVNEADPTVWFQASGDECPEVFEATRRNMRQQFAKKTPSYARSGVQSKMSACTKRTPSLWTS